MIDGLWTLRTVSPSICSGSPLRASDPGAPFGHSTMVGWPGGMTTAGGFGGAGAAAGGVCVGAAAAHRGTHCAATAAVKASHDMRCIFTSGLLRVAGRSTTLRGSVTRITVAPLLGSRRHGSAVRLGDLLGDVEAEAEPVLARPARGRARRPRTGVAARRARFRRRSPPRSPPSPDAVPSSRTRDGLARDAVLQRVAEQVRHHLGQPLGIAIAGQRRRRPR